MSDTNPPPPPYDPNAMPPYAPTPLGYATPTTAPRPTSVLVLGIIGIFFGGLRLLCAPIQVFNFVYASRMSVVTTSTTVTSSTMPATMPATLPTTTSAVGMGGAPSMLMMSWSVLVGVIGLLLGIALLAGGIGSIMLKPWARRLMIVYAIVALLMTALQLITTLALVLPQSLQSPTPAGVPNWATGAILGSAIFVTLIGAIYPTFVLIYYQKPHVVQAFETHQS